MPSLASTIVEVSTSPDPVASIRSTIFGSPVLVTYNQRLAFKTYGITVKVLSIGTDNDEQTVQTQIRLLHQEQSDQGLHCLPFQLYVSVTPQLLSAN